VYQPMIEPAFEPSGRRSSRAAMFAVVAIAKPAPSSATSSVSTTGLVVCVTPANATDDSTVPPAIRGQARCER
jgi:hypothetical protein